MPERSVRAVKDDALRLKGVDSKVKEKPTTS